MNDLRKFIDILNESSQQLDERGGIIDKALSKLQDLPGVLGGDIGTAAAAKVDEKEVYKKIRKAWITKATHLKVDKKDAKAFKAFLQTDMGLPPDQIQQIDGLQGANVDIKKALMGVAGALAAGGVVAAKDKGKDKSAAIKGKVVSGGDIDMAVIRRFEKLGGERDKLSGEGIKIGRKSNQLLKLQRKKGNELELMGYYVLKNAGYLR